jgi:hypothetical protein
MIVTHKLDVNSIFLAMNAIASLIFLAWALFCFPVRKDR